MKAVHDSFTDIEWEHITEIGFTPIQLSGMSDEEHVVRISGGGYQRIICMTPNKAAAELIVELLNSMCEQYR